MKFFIAIAVVLALLALTQAQDDSNQPEPSEPESSPEPPSDESRPPIPEGSGRPPRPGRPGRRPHLHRFPKHQSNEQKQADNGNSEDIPPRRSVFFDVDVDFGKQNIIRAARRHSTTTAAP